MFLDAVAAQPLFGEDARSPYFQRPRETILVSAITDVLQGAAYGSQALVQAATDARYSKRAPYGKRYRKKWPGTAKKAAVELFRGLGMFTGVPTPAVLDVIREVWDSTR